MAAPLQRILIVRTDRLGDVLLTLPMLPVLRGTFPGARLVMLLRRYTGAIVEGNRHLDGILWYDEGKSLVPFLTMLRRVRKERFDVAIVVHPRLRLALMMALAGIPVRVGTGYRYYSVLFNRRVYEHRKDAKRHEAEYNLNLLSPLGCPLPGSGMEADFGVEIPGEAFRTVDRVLRESGLEPGRGYVVVHPGSGGSAREWPLAHFAELIRLLGGAGHPQIVLSGTEEELPRTEELRRLGGGTAVSVAGRFSVKELAALMKGADLCIAHSTGPLHVAAAVGTPVVGLYPQIVPMSPRRWGPYTRNSRVLTPDRPADCEECARGGPCACMASIPAAAVLRAARELLEEEKAMDEGSSGRRA